MTTELLMVKSLSVPRDLELLDLNESPLEIVENAQHRLKHGDHRAWMLQFMGDRHHIYNNIGTFHHRR